MICRPPRSKEKLVITHTAEHKFRKIVFHRVVGTNTLQFTCSCGSIVVYIESSRNECGAKRH